MKKFIFIAVLAVLTSDPHWVLSQDTDALVLSFDEFMNLVLMHHPVARQADLQLDRGDAYVQKSRGAFDPKLYTDIAQKYYKDKQYYSEISTGLKIPTWFGIELTGAFEQNQGVFLNPKNTTPDGGLFYAGISVPIGRGLFIDQRRAELRQAQIYRESTIAMQQQMLNELLYEAGKIYWDWFLANNVLRIYQEGLALAEERFVAVKQSAALGDKPAIDTLEAGIQVQNRRLDLQQAQLDFDNTAAALSVYLWADGTVPLELSEGTVSTSSDSLEALSVDEQLRRELENFIASHPELEQYRFKQEQLEVDRRWKREQLKPKLDVKYNAISEPVNANPLTAYSVNNYTWGLGFSLPLFLRKERGNLQLTEVKIRETELTLMNKRESLLFKAKTSLNTWQTTKQQVDLYTQTVRDYASLLAGERQLFNSGESSIFLINYRESSYINARIKRVELLTKNQKAQMATYYALGILAQ